MSEQQSGGIILPTIPRKPTAVNARDMIISGKPKCGKTTVCAELPNSLLLDVENGSAFIESMVMTPPEGSGPVKKFKWLKEVAKSIVDAGRPYDYVIVDTLSQLDEDATFVGTFNYMNTILGKEFNRKRDDKGNLVFENGKTIMLTPSDPNYQNVITLPNGAGYYHSRSALLDIFETLRYLGRVCTIFICHITDKMIGEKNGEQVMVKDLALTGKLQSIVPRLVDSIATVWNEDGKMMISFDGNSDKIGGIRAKHTIGYVGELQWNKIFI